MIPLYADIETYSEVPIKNGTHAYAESAEILLFAYALDESSAQLWDATEDPLMPQDLYDALHDPDVLVVMHNGGMFDRTVIRHDLGIDLPIERVHDTMVRALTHSLPGALGTLCEVLGVSSDEAKDKEGRQLIQLFCKPRPKNMTQRRATRETHPQEWQKFKDYARSDITAMRAIYKKLPQWNYRGSELALWHLDARSNDNGFLVDTALAEAAIRAVTETQARLAANTSEATYGLVERATQRDQLLGFILGAYGVDLPDLQGSTLERRINDPELPIELRELLAIRLMASTTSVTKYKTLMKAVSPDSRLRGTIQFCGASRTGRDAGRTFQPQNLPRPDMKNKDIDFGIAALKEDIADLLYPNVMKLTSNTIRGCIVAPPGKKLVVADLSNIEGRVAAWLAGEEWKLEAFRAFDQYLLDANGEKIPDGKDGFKRLGPDLYQVAYAKAFDVPPAEAVGDKRQIGKVMELMLQYEGGVGAFLTGAATYGIDLDAMTETAWPTIPMQIRMDVEGFYDWTVKKRRSTFGLAPKTFMTCDALKRMWREAHPQISSYWNELKNAFAEAIEQGGVTIHCRKLKFRRDGAWLRIILPSGRALCYPSPRNENGQLSYMGVNPYTRQWSRIKTYGGKIFENITQACARDVFKGTDMRHG